MTAAVRAYPLPNRPVRDVHLPGDTPPTPTRRPAPMTGDQPMPALSLPAIAVPCPRCGAVAGNPCTSHSGTRPRRSDVHTARTAAHHAQEQTR